MNRRGFFGVVAAACVARKMPAITYAQRHRVYSITTHAHRLIIPPELFERAKRIMESV